jgi:hypothetical protein
VDGLLQTEAYARCMLSGRPNTSEDEIDQLLAARMERQLILDRESPPLLWSVIDEQALHRQVGDAAIMHDQLLHLPQMSQRLNINIQVVPYSAGAHYTLLGAFAIADVDDATRVAYLETVRAEALSRTASRDLIRKRAESYGPDQRQLA